jgi:periplasmic protein TonB
MFRDSLLESALGARRRKRWPMLLAVILEVIVGGALLAIPLFSTGIIPVDAKTPIVAPRVTQLEAVNHPPSGHQGGTGRQGPARTEPAVFTFEAGRRTTGDHEPGNTEGPNVGPDLGLVGPSACACIEPDKPKPPRGPVRRSYVSEGELLHRVEPTYPRFLTFGGEVRLHAIIAKDGTIQSLSVLSGHPLLASAALDAVRQWRYRPYLLNGEPVEVETFITVNFRRDR